MRYIKEIIADIWPVLVLGCIVVVGHYLTKDVEEDKPKAEKPRTEMVHENVAPQEPVQVGDSYKGNIKHLKDSQGRLRCFYSYQDKHGHHRRIFVLGCHKHKNK